MKKSILGFLALIFLLSSFWSCQLFNDDSLSAILFVRHYYTGRRAPDWDVTHVPSVWVSGDISGTQMPEMDYIQIADVMYSGSMYFYNSQGDVHFSSYNRVWSDSIPAPYFDPLSIVISTDIGELTGSITVPDTIETLTISAPDTIPVGGSLSISWSGSNADYYVVEYYHRTMPDLWTILGYSRDTVIAGESVTFDSSYFSCNGSVSDIEVVPFNGPFPEAGAMANMEGDGYGFLFCENQSIVSDRMIIVGRGAGFGQFMKAVNPVEKRSAHDIIIKRLK